MDSSDSPDMPQSQFETIWITEPCSLTTIVKKEIEDSVMDVDHNASKQIQIKAELSTSMNEVAEQSNLTQKTTPINVNLKVCSSRDPNADKSNWFINSSSKSTTRPVVQRLQPLKKGNPIAITKLSHDVQEKIVDMITKEKKSASEIALSMNLKEGTVARMLTQFQKEHTLHRSNKRALSRNQEFQILKTAEENEVFAVKEIREKYLELHPEVAHISLSKVYDILKRGEKGLIVSTEMPQEATHDFAGYFKRRRLLKQGCIFGEIASQDDERVIFRREAARLRKQEQRRRLTEEQRRAIQQADTARIREFRRRISQDDDRAAAQREFARLRKQLQRERMTEEQKIVARRIGAMRMKESRLRLSRERRQQILEKNASQHRYARQQRKLMAALEASQRNEAGPQLL